MHAKSDMRESAPGKFSISLAASISNDLLKTLPLHDQEDHSGSAISSYNPRKLLSPTSTITKVHQDFSKIFAAAINQEQ